MLPQLVNTGFQVLFHSPPGVLFTFPSQYYALSVTGWSPLIPTRFHVSRGTLDPALPTSFSLTGLSPSLAGLPRTILLTSLDHKCGPNPGVHALRFGLFPFRSPLLWKSHVVFFSSGYLDVSVHRVPYVFSIGQLRSSQLGFPIQRSMDLCLFAAPHGFSQLITSFFGS